MTKTLFLTITCSTVRSGRARMDEEILRGLTPRLRYLLERPQKYTPAPHSLVVQDPDHESCARAHFPYIFTPPQLGGGKPRLTLHTVRAGRPFSPLRQLIEQGEHSNHSQKSQIEVLPIELIHGCLRTLGYRFGNLAYLTDVSEVPEHSLALLEGLDVLIVDALRDRPHPTHFSVGQALELVERIRPKRTLFTHICHQLDHEEANSRLPEGVSLAYDEQKISLP